MTDASGIAANQLKSFVDRLERLQSEKDAISEDMKEVRREAKNAGFDLPTIARMLKERKLSDQERAERDALDDTYRQALGMLVDTDLGRSAMRRDGVRAEAEPEEPDDLRDSIVAEFRSAGIMDERKDGKLIDPRTVPKTVASAVDALKQQLAASA